MKLKNLLFGAKTLGSALMLWVFAQAAQAQVFTNGSTGDLMLGFRKTGSFTEAFEVVVDIGQAANYVSLTPGTTITVSNYSASGQLAASFSSLDNLTWAAFGDAHNSRAPGYPVDTMWLSNPRSTVGVQTTTPPRQSQSTQASVVSLIESIINGASDISGRLGASNTFNTTTYVREPLNTNSITQSENLSTYIESVIDPTRGTFKDRWYDANSRPINVENTTPGTFTSALQSDLYEIRPAGNIDPHTGSSTGAAYFVGFFTLNTNGTMSFTRAVSEALAPQLTLARSGNTSTISFNSTNGTTYTLYSTNIAGLSNPTATWPVLGSLSGTGGATNFVDTTTDSNRVYRVSAH